ncbi:hypothetical protein NEIMUCOT_04117 [Neisseria mucosa ATCC 25996]|uniref:Uncharacterized protein n=1 Tax=Neisseria mucosa (strain ATCC 25996 / DSM 4631 / NCTC 10774 / M26) TaxID=546266 RepID=D2ZU28_NEIM2|nr:hypothetical protein NEIMUCOT_04117 [Neisseria mucosa ATCC 25996]
MKGNGDGFGGFAHAEVEGFAAVGVSERADEDDGAVVEAAVDGVGIGFADDAGVAHIYAVNDAERTGGEEIARSGGNRFVAQGCGCAAAQGGFDVAAYHTDRLLGVAQGGVVGNAAVAVVLRNELSVGGEAVEEMARAVYQHEAHAQAGEQVEIGGKPVQGVAFEQAVGDADNQCFAAQVVDIGRGFAKIGNKARRCVHNKTR